MEGTLYIKLPSSSTWTDAYAEYGIFLEDTSLSKLMTPAPNKDYVENVSRLQDGKRVIRTATYAKKKDRNVSLVLFLKASSKSDFLEKYGNFCTEILNNGFFDIKTSYQDGVVYRMTYIDCTQFSEFSLGLAKFTLSLNEPDPSNRGASSNW